MFCTFEMKTSVQSYSRIKAAFILDMSSQVGRLVDMLVYFAKIIQLKIEFCGYNSDKGGIISQKNKNGNDMKPATLLFVWLGNVSKLYAIHHY